MTLLELTFQRRKAHSEANAMLDCAVLENRNLTIAEQVRFDALLARVAELDASIEARAALRRMV